MKVLSGELFPEKQLQREIVSGCRQALKDGKNRRDGVKTPAEWMALKEEYLKVIRGAFPDIGYQAL